MYTHTIMSVNTHGSIAKVLVTMGRKYQPSDTTAELEQDTALELLKFGGQDANAYYNAVVKILTQYLVAESDDDLIKPTARKVSSATYTKMIVDHLKAGGANNFQGLYNDISTVQRLVGVSNSNGKKRIPKRRLLSWEPKRRKRRRLERM